MGCGRRGPDDRDRVLVIGCGFLGGHIACGLAERGVGVRVLSRSFAPRALRQLPADRLILADARHPDALKVALDGIDEVIYCVGGLQPAEAELARERDEAMLVAPLREVLTQLAEGPKVAITYLSSGGAVYGNPVQLPVRETTPPNPIGVYAAVRLAGERVLARAHERYGLPVRILRCANVYGEDQPINRGQGAVGVFLDRIARGQVIEVFGDGSVVRDYVYVGDLVEAVARLIGRDGLTVLNVGSGIGTSLTELIALLETALGRRAITAPRPARGFDVQRVVLDVTKLRQLLGTQPLTLAQGIRCLVPVTEVPVSEPVSAPADLPSAAVA
jgi:UDP-glucose 4-epimerase